MHIEAGGDGVGLSIIYGFLPGSPDLIYVCSFVILELGQSVETKFKRFAKTILFFEKRSYASWSESINAVAMVHLKQNLLKRDPETGEAPQCAELHCNPRCETGGAQALSRDRPPFTFPKLMIPHMSLSLQALLWSTSIAT